MANIVASELNALQTRINAERGRRSLSNVTFTDGLLSSGDIIKSVHFTELRNYVESLNTKSSVTFNWTGSTTAGVSITDVLPQINTYLTTLENEALASWKTLTPVVSVLTNTGSGYSGRPPYYVFEIPVEARGAANLVRFERASDFSNCDPSFKPGDGQGNNINCIQLFATKSTVLAQSATSYGADNFIHGRAYTETGALGTNMRCYTDASVSPGTTPRVLVPSELCVQTKHNSFAMINENTNIDTVFSSWGDLKNVPNKSVFYADNVFNSTYKYVMLYIGKIGTAAVPSVYGSLKAYY